MNDEDASALKTHLEYTGYTVEIDKDKDLICKHDRYFNVVGTKLQGGVVFIATFGEIDTTKTIEALTAVNQFNLKASNTMSYITDAGRLGISSWYPLPYDKASFSTFLDAFHIEQTKWSGAKITVFVSKAVTSSEKAPSSERSPQDLPSAPK
jgi:hypothetical protein